MDTEYKKSYKGFFLWLISFVAAMAFAAKISTGMSENNAVLLTFTVTLLMIDLLIYIIYVTENIYWINGVSYNEAKKATPEQRKQYAREHVTKFVNATFLWAVYLAGKFFFHIPLWADIIIYLILVIGAAVSTVKIKLETA